MSSELRVVGLSVTDVLGAKEFKLQPGKAITLLRGPNGSGKSTALKAVQAALQGGNLAKLARVDKAGAEVDPEVVLLIEGPGHEAYRVERKGSTVRVRQRVRDTAAFEDVGKPQTWLRSLYDPLGANPVAFLTAKDDDRATMLLEALKLPYSRAELLRAMGLTPEEIAALPPIPEGLHPLEELALIRDAVFKTRTAVNRDEHGKRTAAEEVRLNAPAEVPSSPAEDALRTLEEQVLAEARQLSTEQAQAEAAATAAQRAARAEYERAELASNTEARRRAAELRAGHEQEAARIRAEAEARIAELAKAVEAQVEEARAAADTELDEAAARRDKALEAALATAGQALEAINVRRAEHQRRREELAAGRARREESAKARALHEQAAKFDADAAALKAESVHLTEALDALDAFRRGLAKGLPIAGLEVEGKLITVNGVPYEQLNLGQQVELAVQVAVLRAKGSRLPVVFVDGAEALDDQRFELLVERLKAAGVQAFIGRVDNTPELEVVRE